MQSVLSTTSDLGAYDAKQAAAIETRRRLEAERLARIRDPKTRTMGIDTQSLALQIAEKDAARAAQYEVDQTYGENAVAMDRQLSLMEQERLRAVRSINKNVDDFRRDCQGKTLSREFDLNNPDELKNDLPARTDDMDPRLSTSGMQQFLGEDLSYANRVKAQQKLQAEWNAEAVAFKQLVKEAEAADAAEADKMAYEFDALKTSMELQTREARRAMNVSTMEYQKWQMESKRNVEEARKQAELQDNIEEVQTQLAGDLLTENPLCGRSYVASNRLRPDHFKGFSAEATESIFRQQEEQRQEAALLKASQQAEEAAADNVMEQTRRLGCYTDAQVAYARAQMRKQIAEDNKELADHQSKSQTFLKSEVYVNAVDAGFFEQFGNTSR